MPLPVGSVNMGANSGAMGCIDTLGWEPI